MIPLWLTKIILLDSGKIQEEDAKRQNKYNYTKHKPAKPLYDIEDAKTTISHLKTFDLNKWYNLDNEIEFKFLNSGHILGSAIILIKVNKKIIAFSGDLGRKSPIILPQFEYIEKADYLVVESTYGNRIHKKVSIIDNLLKYIEHTYSKKGILIIPTFSVERAQEIIYLLSILKREKKLPNIPIYLDSPMGVNATEVYFKHKKIHNLTENDIKSMLQTVQLISDVGASKAVVNDNAPKIVLAGSGMLTGGRMLNYLETQAQNPNNTLLFVGYQGEGTRGRSILRGSSEVKFFGRYHNINCDIRSISSLSAHGDQKDIVTWLKNIQEEPIKLFINHSEKHQSEALLVKIRHELGWECTTVPSLNQSYILS